MKTATGNAVLQAYSKAVKRLQSDKGMSAAATSAGFIIPNGQKKGNQTGFQVFVKVCRFSEALLKLKPVTGGLLAAILIIGLSGCKSGPTLQISPAIVQAGVTTGVRYSVTKYPDTIPYLRASSEVICSAAAGTNISPANIVAAIEASNATALKTPVGALILQTALTLYIGIYNSYLDSAITNRPALVPYLKATCDGLVGGLPPVGPGAAARARRVAPVPSSAWPQIKL